MEDITFEGTTAQLGSGALSLGPNVVPLSSSEAARALLKSSESSSLVRSMVGMSGFSGLEAVAFAS